MAAKTALLASEEAARKTEAAALARTSQSLSRIRDVELPAWKARAEVAAERLEKQADLAQQQV